MTNCYTFCSLESRSDAKMTAFLPGPLQYPHLDKDNKDAAPPGCGPAAIEALNGKEIFTLHQLCGQFMLLDRDVNLMLQWCVAGPIAVCLRTCT